MKTPTEYSFTQYLQAKKTVEDRSLNRVVWDELFKRINPIQSPIRILDIGGGIGTMLTRIIDWGLINSCEYVLIDNDSENIEKTPSHLIIWAENNNCSINQINSNRWEIKLSMGIIHLQLIHDDVFNYSRSQVNKFDLIIGHAVLDLFDLETDLPRITSLLKSNSLGYFTINYDGLTIFEPSIDSIDEESIINAYNNSMDTRVTNEIVSGDSQAGRHLFSLFTKLSDISLISAGSSDWVVFPTKNEYKAEEAYFLHHILSFFEQSLNGTSEINNETFHKWLDIRHNQIESGELFFMAHQYDFLIQKS